ncbi:hypothetical protein [Embleya sp. NPDC005575]|uniref:hypothetical protein n=1 Tax=Embleya sp. NPDC005575 TaxID=3156892 RepID=UPI0033B118AC
MPTNFIRAINAHVDPPDLAVVLTASADTITRRLTARGAHHRFEDDPDNVRRELDLYEQAIPILESTAVRVLRVDATTVTPEGAADAILRVAGLDWATVPRTRSATTEPG